MKPVVYKKLMSSSVMFGRMLGAINMQIDERLFDIICRLTSSHTLYKTALKDYGLLSNGTRTNTDKVVKARQGLEYEMKDHDEIDIKFYPFVGNAEAREICDKPCVVKYCGIDITGVVNI